VEFAAAGGHPGVEYGGHGEGLAVLAADEEGLLRTGTFRLPFVEAIGRHQRAVLAEGAAEARLFGDGLGAGIDEDRLRHFPRPGGDEAPADEEEAPRARMAPFPLADDDGDGLGGRDVVARREIRLVEIAEKFTHRLRGQGYRVASAH